MLASNFQSFAITQMQFGKILLMSILSGFLGLLFYYKGLANTKAKIASITEMSFPIWVVLLNWIFLNQKLTMLQIGGAIILMASIYSLQEKEV
jgi:drug/metabolite transporter (DMT)-like permease